MGSRGVRAISVEECMKRMRQGAPERRESMARMKEILSELGYKLGPEKPTALPSMSPNDIVFLREHLSGVSFLGPLRLPSGS